MSTETRPKPNYCGSVIYDEYEGQFSGYTLSLTVAEMQEAIKKADHNGRVRIRVKNGRDPKKPYAILVEPKPQQSEGLQQSPDLPF